MRKITFALIGGIFSLNVIAADVAERQSCADIKARIDTLAAEENLNDSDAALLTDLRTKYRRDCMARASGRGARTIAATRGLIKTNDDTTGETKKEDVDIETKKDDVADVVQKEEQPVIAEKCDNPDSNGCCPGEEFADMGTDGKFCCKGDMCFPPMNPSEPQKTEEEIVAEIAANIEKGLCGDGTKPNKFGCCDGEIFKDLGNATFACCKKDSDECFPPMN